MAIIQKIKEVVSRKEFWVVVFGFGLAGALWGWECYRGTVGADDVITNPFSFILGAVFLGVFGGIALAFIENLSVQDPTLAKSVKVGSWQSLRIKRVVKIVLFGTIGCLVGFLVPAIFSYPLYLIGSGFLPFFLGILTIPLGFMGYNNIINPILEPSLFVGYFWLEFLLTGAIIALSYTLILKAKIKPLVLRGAIGFAIASIISPIIGNLIGNNLLNSLFSAYIITFALISVIFGLSLSFKLLGGRVSASSGGDPSSF